MENIKLSDSELSIELEKANSGNEDSCRKIAMHYYFSGDGNSATKWIKHLADNNDAESQFILARCCTQTGNFTLGLELSKKSALNGHRHAQLDLGTYYYYGYCGVKVDIVEAIKWYKLAAKQNDLRSQLRLGEHYAKGYGEFKVDIVEALKWYKLAEMQNDSEAIKFVARYDEKTNSDLKNKAHKGDINAQLLLGECYYDYHSGNKKYSDLTEAFEWYLMAAKKGNPIAEYEIGKAYIKGWAENGIRQDDSKAFEWITLAACHGNADAQCKMGDFYSPFEGPVNKDFKQAKDWYLKAISQEHYEAAKKLRKIVNPKISEPLSYESIVGNSSHNMSDLDRAQFEENRKVILESQTMEFVKSIFKFLGKGGTILLLLIILLFIIGVRIK